MAYPTPLRPPRREPDRVLPRELYPMHLAIRLCGEVGGCTSIAHVWYSPASTVVWYASVTLQPWNFDEVAPRMRKRDIVDRKSRAVARPSFPARHLLHCISAALFARGPLQISAALSACGPPLERTASDTGLPLSAAPVQRLRSPIKGGGPLPLYVGHNMSVDSLPPESWRLQNLY